VANAVGYFSGTMRIGGVIIGTKDSNSFGCVALRYLTPKSSVSLPSGGFDQYTAVTVDEVPSIGCVNPQICNGFVRS